MQYGYCHVYAGFRESVVPKRGVQEIQMVNQCKWCILQVFPVVYNYIKTATKYFENVSGMKQYTNGLLVIKT